jgi:molecular chaperone GrpE
VSEVSRSDVKNPLGEGELTPAEFEDPSAAALATALQERDQFAAEAAKLKEEKADLNDRLLRAQAEFQNYRRRADKEKLEFVEYASSEAVLALLPVLDDFERSLQADTTDAAYAKGITLIYQRFFEALKKLGLEPIDSVGKLFDPHIHHAVEKVETDEVPPETVLAEYQKAYNFKGRLLRPAMVKVAVEPSSKA